jgi:hypothetical protein
VAEKEWNPPESSGDGSDDEATCVEVEFGGATAAIQEHLLFAFA